MGSNPTTFHKNNVHKVLAHSYATCFFFFLIGIYLDLVFSARGGSAFGGKVFNSSITIPIGFIFIIAGTFLVFWAQKTSKNFKKENITKENFSQGPYRFTRTPTNFGIFFLMLGFGMVTDAFFIILFSFVSFLIAKFFFLKKEERILSEKYGAPYLEYKQSVKF